MKLNKMKICSPHEKKERNKKNYIIKPTGETLVDSKKFDERCKTMPQK